MNEEITYYTIVGTHKGDLVAVSLTENSKVGVYPTSEFDFNIVNNLTGYLHIDDTDTLSSTVFRIKDQRFLLLQADWSIYLYTYNNSILKLIDSYIGVINMWSHSLLWSGEGFVQTSTNFLPIRVDMLTLELVSVLPIEVLPNRYLLEITLRAYSDTVEKNLLKHAYVALNLGVYTGKEKATLGRLFINHNQGRWNMLNEHFIRTPWMTETNLVPIIVRTNYTYFLVDSGMTPSELGHCVVAPEGVFKDNQGVVQDEQLIKDWELENFMPKKKE